MKNSLIDNEMEDIEVIEARERYDMNKSVARRRGIHEKTQWDRQRLGGCYKYEKL